jgi:hypothetical protein
LPPSAKQIFQISASYPTVSGRPQRQASWSYGNIEDIRREPIEDRRRRLAAPLRLPYAGIAINEHFGDEGPTIYKHACALGCEGSVSKRLGSSYRAGRSATGSRSAAPAVMRVVENDWR